MELRIFVEPQQGATYDDQLAVALTSEELDGETFSYAGARHPVTTPEAAEAAQRPHPPIIIGGKGAKRTPALTATYADEFNLPFVGLDECRAADRPGPPACEAIGRDPYDARYSNAHTICCGRDEAELERRPPSSAAPSTTCARTPWPARRPRSSTDRPVRRAGLPTPLPPGPRPARPRPPRAAGRGGHAPRVAGRGVSRTGCRLPPPGSGVGSDQGPPLG